MGAALILLTLSALIGFGLGRFSWLAIATASVVLALLSAFVLQMQGFSTPSGIAIIVVCLTVSQAAYLMGGLFRGRPKETSARRATCGSTGIDTHSGTQTPK
jgi:uncharacterized membrane protein